MLDHRADTELASPGDARLDGALLAAAVVIRSGAQRGPFTDTTDSATNLAAAAGNAKPGQRWRTRIVNATRESETIAPGAGVSLIGAAKIAPGKWRDFDFTVSATGTLLMMSVGGGMN